MLQRSRWSWSHRCLLARAFEDEHCHSNYSSFSGAVIVGILFPVLWQRLLPLCCEVMPAQSNEAGHAPIALAACYHHKTPTATIITTIILMPIVILCHPHPCGKLHPASVTHSGKKVQVEITASPSLAFEKLLPHVRQLHTGEECRLPCWLHVSLSHWRVEDFDVTSARASDQFKLSCWYLTSIQNPPWSWLPGLPF